MRHKEHISHDLNAATPEVLRLQRYAIADPEEMQLAARHAFSEMKYGHPRAIMQVAQELAQLLLADAHLQAWVQANGCLWIAASAYGAVPSAAAALTDVVMDLLRQAGWVVMPFKIEREGGFERMNYGALGQSARERAIRHRKISLMADVATSLRDAAVLVIDDLRCTGSHEAAILQLLMQQTQVAQVAFTYCITFEGEMEAAQEEQLNHARIRQLEDLLPLFQDAAVKPSLNARLLKFILRHPVPALQAFWRKIGREAAWSLYEAALTPDGYYDMTRFRAGFASLEAWLHPQGTGYRRSYGYRSQVQGKVVAYHLCEDKSGQFECAETGRSLQEEVARYSRFKFGDVPALNALVNALTQAMIANLEAEGRLRTVFERASRQGEFISLTAPGVRNVISASNQLAREVGLRVNAWLSHQGLPTMVIRTLGRLSSGRANYAELSAKQRASREKTTQTIIPRSEYQTFPSHVIFLDDVEVSGQTSNRARQKTLKAGALSFHGVFAFKVDPLQAMRDAGIEHRMNQFEITGKLDATLANVLNHPDYQPVQRMLRLLLHPSNTGDLPAFLQDQVSDRILTRLYLGAMANDYAWIHADAPGQKGEYAPSLQAMQQQMQLRGLILADGRLVGDLIG
jgi:PRTase ComF-like